MYQREYKWENEKIETLIWDINTKSKFIGNIIIDELSDKYEIVDGQQRITTLYLLLICLYNIYYGSPLEQHSICNLIKPYNTIILKNQSIGDFICEVDNKILLNINDEQDPYFQKDEFNRAFLLISRLIDEIKEKFDIREFKRKLFDCQLLVLINEDHHSTTPVEQIYLDINEKAQILDVEDIFKGHCFENCTPEYRDYFKELWISLKKEGMLFSKTFYYKDLNEYIYHFLLQKESNILSEKLKINNKHYLDGKTIDQTESLLKHMIAYGKNINIFYSKLHELNYKFSDVCFDSARYETENDHINLKHMIARVLEYDNSLFQKIPMFVFVNNLYLNKPLQENLQYEDFKKIITNLYIYAMLFTFKKTRKSKKDIDYTIRGSLSASPLDMTQIVSAAKNLRKNAVDQFRISTNTGFEFFAFIYSIIDLYISNKNWIPTLYSNKDYGTIYNLEHFIIPDNRQCTISWRSTHDSLSITLPPTYKREHKKKFINYLVIDKVLNGNMESWDIVSKIEYIKNWYSQLQKDIPKHILIFINEIEQMPEYKELVRLKSMSSRTKEEVQDKYKSFLDAYFEEDHSACMIQKIEQSFKLAFQN